MTPAQIKREIRSEFKQWKNQPKPQKEWELIWVITGPEVTLDGSIAHNETRRRLEEGIRLAKKVEKLRKSATLGGRAPKVYISGYDPHNTYLREYRSLGFFEKIYTFPAEKILIGPQEGILHTKHQFEKFPREFFVQFKKIVVVSDAYHIPRITRYASTFPKEEQDKFVFYPSKPIILSGRRVRGEVDRILTYAQKGDLPLFAKQNNITKVVITGATGFLGSHLTSALLKMQNVSVETFDRKKHSFTDKESLQKLLTGADVIFHLAGIKRVERKKDSQFNISSTKALLDAMCLAAPDATLVFTSSFAVYRAPRKGKTIQETSVLLPRGEYGRSKLACERMIRDYTKRYGIRAVIFRISNLYGPTHRPSDFIVESILSALQTGTSVHIRGSLDETRDFIYVSDVVNAFQKVLTRTYKKGSFDVFNICTGEETSTKSLLQMIERLTGRRIPLTMHSSVDHVPSFWKGSLQKAKEGLQWHPLIRIQRGLRSVFG